jgi:hypothetical protein
MGVPLIKHPLSAEIFRIGIRTGTKERDFVDER